MRRFSYLNLEVIRSLIYYVVCVVENNSSEPFAFPKTFSTLRRLCLVRLISKALPLNEVELKIFPQAILKDEDEEKLTPVLAKYIPLEVCLAE